MIKISNLSKSFGPQLLLDNVTFNINPKEKIGLVGRNGHGKTSLFRLLLGQEEPDTGEIQIPKDYRVGYLEQHIHFSQPTVIDEACLGLPADQKHDGWRAEKVLTGLGFSEHDLTRHPLDFSGGFQVRLNLAKVLISDADLLLLDEPTNYLDIVSIRWLIQFLNQWPNESMLITHDRQFMDQVTTHTLGIHRTQIKKIAGHTRKYFTQITQEEEIHEKTRLNDDKKRKETELFISRFRAKARLAGMVQSRIKALEKQKTLAALEKIETMDFEFSAESFSAKTMMTIENLEFGYPDQKQPLIQHLNLIIGKQDRIAVIGKNGKGKSTLFRLLNQELMQTNGVIKTHPTLKIGYYGQTNVERLQPNLTIEEELTLADPEHSRQRARNAAGTMMFSGDLALKKIQVLSGGEKSRVLLGKLLLTPAHLLLLDEPTNHLDLESCEALMNAVKIFQGSIVMVTHDEGFLHTMANKLIVFDQNQVFVFNGSYQNFLDEIGWENPNAAARLSKINAMLSSGDNENERSSTSEQQTEPIGKKNIRQSKAKLLKEKSKLLKPLNNKITQLENDITTLEEQLVANNSEMIKASINGDSLKLATLPKAKQVCERHIEELFQQLEKITEQRDKEAKLLDKKLSSYQE